MTSACPSPQFGFLNSTARTRPMLSFMSSLFLIGIIVLCVLASFSSGDITITLGPITSRSDPLGIVVGSTETLPVSFTVAMLATTLDPCSDSILSKPVDVREVRLPFSFSSSSGGVNKYRPNPNTDNNPQKWSEIFDSKTRCAIIALEITIYAGNANIYSEIITSYDEDDTSICDDNSDPTCIIPVLIPHSPLFQSAQWTQGLGAINTMDNDVYYTYNSNSRLFAMLASLKTVWDPHEVLDSDQSTKQISVYITIQYPSLSSNMEQYNMFDNNINTNNTLLSNQFSPYQDSPKTIQCDPFVVQYSSSNLSRTLNFLSLNMIKACKLYNNIPYDEYNPPDMEKLLPADTVLVASVSFAPPSTQSLSQPAHSYYYKQQIIFENKAIIKHDSLIQYTQYTLYHPGLNQYIEPIADVYTIPYTRLNMTISILPSYNDRYFESYISPIIYTKKSYLVPNYMDLLTPNQRLYSSFGTEYVALNIPGDIPLLFIPASPNVTTVYDVVANLRKNILDTKKTFLSLFSVPNPKMYWSFVSYVSFTRGHNPPVISEWVQHAPGLGLPPHFLTFDSVDIIGHTRITVDDTNNNISFDVYNSRTQATEPDALLSRTISGTYRTSHTSTEYIPFTYSLSSYTISGNINMSEYIKYPIAKKDLFIVIETALNLSESSIYDLHNVIYTVTAQITGSNDGFVETSSSVPTNICGMGQSGPECEFSTLCESRYNGLDQCNHRGFVDSKSGTCDYSCTCDDGWMGDDCSQSAQCSNEYSQHKLCNGHGYIHYEPMGQTCAKQCTCRYPYTGPQCDKITNCADAALIFSPCPNGSKLASFYDPKTRNCIRECVCDGVSETCGENSFLRFDTLNTCYTSQCRCMPNNYGPNCEYSLLSSHKCIQELESLNYCNNRGTVLYNDTTRQCDTQCTCTQPTAWGGPSCAKSTLCEASTPDEAGNGKQYCPTNGFIPYTSTPASCGTSCSCIGGFITDDTSNDCTKCNIACYQQGVLNPKAYCQDNLKSILPCICRDDDHHKGRYCQYQRINDLIIDINDYILPNWLISPILYHSTDTILLSSFTTYIEKLIASTLGYTVNSIVNDNVSPDDPIKIVDIDHSAIKLKHVECQQSTLEVPVVMWTHISIPIYIHVGITSYPDDEAIDMKNQISTFITNDFKNGMIVDLMSRFAIPHSIDDIQYAICTNTCNEQYIELNHCSGHGAVLQTTSSDGATTYCQAECTCEDGWGGNTCSQITDCNIAIQKIGICPSGQIHHTTTDVDTGICTAYCSCPPSDTGILEVCSGNGIYQGHSDGTCDTTCTCDHGWYGSECQHNTKCYEIISNLNNCEQRGTVEYNPITNKCNEYCTCNDDDIWTGTTCQQNIECVRKASQLQCGSYGYVTSSIHENDNDDDDNTSTIECNTSCTCLFGWGGPTCSSCPIKCRQQGAYNPSSYCQDNLVSTPPCLCQINTIGRYCEYYEVPTKITIRNRSLPEWLVTSALNHKEANAKTTLFLQKLAYEFNILLGLDADKNIIHNTSDAGLQSNPVPQTIVPITSFSISYTSCHDNATSKTMKVPSTLSFTTITRVGSKISLISREATQIYSKWNSVLSTPLFVSTIQKVFTEYDIRPLGFDTVSQSCIIDDSNPDVDGTTEEPKPPAEEEEQEESTNSAYSMYNANDMIYIIFILYISLCFVLY